MPVAPARKPARRRTPNRRKVSRKARIEHFVKRLRVVRAGLREARTRRRLGWKARQRDLLRREGAILGKLRALGWKPPRAEHAQPTGENADPPDMDELGPMPPVDEAAILAELEEEDEDGDEQPVTSGNWLYGHGLAESELGADKDGRPFQPLAALRTILPSTNWSRPVPLGASARLQTQPGTHAMVMDVKPGLFVVQLVPDAVARKIAGDDIGALPLLLLPGIAKLVNQKLATAPAPAAGQPGGPGYVPPAAEPSTGCDQCPPSGRGCSCSRCRRAARRRR